MIACKNYTIHFDDWVSLEKLIEAKNYSKVIILVDENTKTHCLPIVQRHLNSDVDIIEILSGELHKNLTTCQFIWGKMLELGADRHSLCINLGGGVIGDMGGFSAATFMRGMDFIQIPTTLLSQVDASVGGKLGIDFYDYKNLIGLIKDPNGVFIFPAFLDTLSPEQIRSGYAEVIKHGLIADKAIFEELENIDTLENVNWSAIIHPSVCIKKNIVENDPTEKSIRKVLNFGHTLGHAIETLRLSTESPFLHGEAIAIGMVMESYLSHLKGHISLDDCNRIKAYFLQIFGHHPQLIPSYEEVLPIMKKDKKNMGGTIMFSLLSEIGSATYNEEVTPEQIKEAMDYYLQ